MLQASHVGICIKVSAKLEKKKNERSVCVCVSGLRSLTAAAPILYHTHTHALHTPEARKVV